MKNKLIVFLIAAVALMVLPLIAQSAGNFWVRMLDFALLYVLLALGLNIVVGYAGLLDLGYVAFYAVGAYMFGLMASPHLAENFATFKAAFPTGLHSPIWLVIPLGAGLAGLAGMSGYLPLAASTAAERSAANQGLPVFLAHGQDDDVVVPARGLAARDALQALGHPVQWHAYPMGHSVCIEEITALDRWLKQVLGR